MPAAARPVWKGHIRLSLVSIPVELFSATKTSAKISFRQIHEPSGKPVNYQKVVQGIGPVDTDEILKGFEYEKGHYVLLSDEDVEDVKLETKKTLELTQFVDACEIPPLYFDKPYYILPQDDLAEDAFRVIRDALRQSGKVGLGQLAMRGKEHICAVKPCGQGLLLETLRYEEEIRKADPFFREIGKEKADDDLLAVATQLIDKKTSKFDAANFKDHYTNALREVIDRKLKGKTPKTVETEEPRPSGGNVVDLMAALKKSLEGGSGGAAEKPKSGAAKAQGPAAAKEAAPSKPASRAKGASRSPAPKAAAPKPSTGRARKSA